jgi:hypothetical protein
MSRKNVRIRISSLAEQGSERDFLDMTPAQRLGVMWQLAVDAWALMGEPVVESRLPRHVVRVIRGER